MKDVGSSFGDLRVRFRSLRELDHVLRGSGGARGNDEVVDAKGRRNGSASGQIFERKL